MKKITQIASQLFRKQVLIIMGAITLSSLVISCGNGNTQSDEHTKATEQDNVQSEAVTKQYEPTPEEQAMEFLQNLCDSEQPLPKRIDENYTMVSSELTGGVYTVTYHIFPTLLYEVLKDGKAQQKQVWLSTVRGVSGMPNALRTAKMNFKVVMVDEDTRDSHSILVRYDEI